MYFIIIINFTNNWNSYRMSHGEIIMEMTILIPLIFFSAILSGAFSMGGGVLALATLGSVLDPSSLLPVHGIIQLTSNTSRSIFAWKHIRFYPVLTFAAGTFIGALAGRFFLPAVPIKSGQIILSFGILLFTWLPPIGHDQITIFRKGNYAIAGSMAGYISLFLGVSGPIIAPFYLRDYFSKEGLVATKSASQMFTHACKLGVFLSLGRLNSDIFKTALIFIPFVIIGNWIGQRLLQRLSEKKFYLIIRIMITGLVLKMLYSLLI